MSLLTQSTRVALAALLHDIGKLAERAGLAHDQRLETHRQLYCPAQQPTRDPRSKYFTHTHAAYTALAWDALEASGHFPDLRRDAAPFAAAGDADVTDSAINAAAAHHCPQTFLQWIVATADRVASGFEREKFESEYNQSRDRDNHYTARLLTLFEQLQRAPAQESELAWRYPLLPLSPQSIFPQAAAACTPGETSTARQQYHALWDALLAGVQQIPASHRANLPLWLDHFDSLWLTITHAIPAATAFHVKPEVSLYDHSKATAALATALWRWHHAQQCSEVPALRQGWHEAKLLLVQGDFFGIQDFLFADGSETQKNAHKLLRGRSFQVSLLAECAALKLLEALDLPSTSQIVNAAGKFLLVAPNTADAQQAIARCRQELDAWCRQHTCGEISVGIATTAASCNDLTQARFKDLTQRLFAALDIAKHQRFALCDAQTPAIFSGYLDRFDNTLGACRIDGRLPADAQASAQRGFAVSTLASDQIRIGEELTRKARLLVARDVATLPPAQTLTLDYFGYRLAIVPQAEESGKYGELARQHTLRRVWDFDAPEADGSLWRGYARRFVNTYVARFADSDLCTPDKYTRANARSDDRAGNGKRAGDEPIASGAIKTLEHLACEDRRLLDGNRWRGEIALVTIKGDIDNLGEIFQKGLEKPTFAKMAALSRQVHAFFAVWLPWYCEHHREHGVAPYRNTYTVFAGGDDFFLIGPWESTLALATALRQQFAQYVAGNAKITFSAGLAMTHPKTPLRQLAHNGEDALAAAKEHPGKNAASLWRCQVSWDDWRELLGARQSALQALIERAAQHGATFSSGLVYGLLQLADRSESQRPEDAIWRSQLHYQLARFFRDRVKGRENAAAQRDKLLADALHEIGGALVQHKGAYRLPLSVLLYQQRE